MTTLLRQSVSFATVACIAVILFVAPACAAEPGSEEELEQLMALMTQRLNLSDYQVEVIRPRLRKHLDAMRELFASYRFGGAGSIPSLLQEFAEMREGFRADLDVELDDRQMLGLAELRDEVDISIRETVIAYRVDALREKLGLNGEQVDAVRPIIAEAFDERQKLMSFHTDAAGGGARFQRNLGPEMEQVDAKMESRLQGVLTQQQMDQYRVWLAAERESLREKGAVSQ
ncbi:MAG TPA: hypothetical protein VFG08_09695 [Candidatus Polarisedimenticolia bacterium]|nr:hypothetical protein [Candidatus Polarisedimenticolia bacterium]